MEFGPRRNTAGGDAEIVQHRIGGLPDMEAVPGQGPWNSRCDDTPAVTGRVPRRCAVHARSRIPVIRATWRAKRMLLSSSGVYPMILFALVMSQKLWVLLLTP